MDRSKGYNRRLRKTLHILAGVPAFVLPYIPLWAALVVAIPGTVVAYWLRPKHAWWLRYISKPEDRNRNVITGLRGYATVILVLIVAGCLLDLAFRGEGQVLKRYIMLGWLALAFGDGMAGLVGPGPTKARTVPWNRHKTWWGLIGCYVGVAFAYYASFAVPFPGLSSTPLNVLLTAGPAVALLVALLESLHIKLDDNYLVGFSAPAIAMILHTVLV